MSRAKGQKSIRPRPDGLCAYCMQPIPEGRKERGARFCSRQCCERSTRGVVSKLPIELQPRRNCIGCENRIPLERHLNARYCSIKCADRANNRKWQDSGKSRQWKRDHKEQELNSRRLREHGLSTKEYDAIWKAQKGRCAICGLTEKESSDSDKWLSVDHDHKCCSGYRQSCGECTRGLLCHWCNRMLGLIEAMDDPQVWLKAATDYLEDFK